MKIVKRLNSYIIKENTGRKCLYSDYPFLVFTRDGELEFECDSLEECTENIIG